MNTPKHVAMQRALGFATPHYAHMPVIFNMSGGKMSKRDKEKAIAKGEAPPEIEVHDFRAAGYLPEAVVNFIALLGWNPGDDREQFDLAEMTSLFSIDRIGKTNAKFDRTKLLSFNTDWAARVSPSRLLEAFKDFLAVAQNVPPRAGQADDALLENMLRACQGFRTFPDVLTKAGYLFIDDDAIVYAPKAVKKVMAKNDGEGYKMLDALLPRLRDWTDWSAEPIETLVKTICEEQGVGMGKVAQPLRVALTGSTVSPSIGQTLAMLGKERTLGRIERCAAST